MVVEMLMVKSLAAKENQKIIVFSAMGLYEPVNEICKQFEKESRIKVLCNFGNSKALATQAINGYKFDIVLFANYENMEELKTKGLILSYDKFLKNHLVIIKNKKCKTSIKNINDLAKDSITIAVGDKSIPAGQYFYKSLDKSLKEKTISNKQKEKIEKNIKTRELTVRDILTKVLTSYVDVGVLYETSELKTKYKNQIEVINLPELKNTEAIFTISISKKSLNNNNVKKLYKYLTQKNINTFIKYGFKMY